MANFQVHKWVRDERNPILPPGQNDFDNEACMNPFVVRHADQYFMFYAGGAKAARRICLATAPVDNLTSWRRMGPLLELGAPGTFDSRWGVAPCVHRVGDKWHLYYTGRDHSDSGLQAFCGIGLATSDDLLNWTKYSEELVLRGDGIAEVPGNRGIAGGGRIVELMQDGRKLYRLHYTLTTGTPSPDLLVDQAKIACVAHSYDGLEWFDKRAILRPRLEADYENAAVTALNVWPTSTRYRCIYSSIGSRFGAYSLSEAVSDDGLVWERGEPDQNLSLTPQGEGWESGMVAYANIVEEGNMLRLFYCGNRYGQTGIGTAVAEKLE